MSDAGEMSRRPAPRAVPLFSSYCANKPAPIFRGLRYHIHKTTPSHIFGWLRSLLIVSPTYMRKADDTVEWSQLGMLPTRRSRRRDPLFRHARIPQNRRKLRYWADNPRMPSWQCVGNSRLVCSFGKTDKSGSRQGCEMEEVCGTS
jgi:hypothetical protein